MRCFFLLPAIWPGHGVELVEPELAEGVRVDHRGAELRKSAVAYALLAAQAGGLPELQRADASAVPILLRNGPRRLLREVVQDALGVPEEAHGPEQQHLSVPHRPVG